MDPSCVIGVLEHAIEVQRISMVRFSFVRGELSSRQPVECSFTHNLEAAVEKFPDAYLIEFYVATRVIVVTQMGEIELIRQNEKVSKTVHINPQVIALNELQERLGEHGAEAYGRHLKDLGPGAQMILPAGQRLGHDRLIFVRAGDPRVQLHFTD